MIMPFTEDFVQAIPAQPAKNHTQNAIFHRQTALSQGISAPIILVNNRRVLWKKNKV
jgi:hypothetical protein